MANIASLFGLLEQLESPKLHINQKKCTLIRNRNGQCLLCLEACTTGCISFDEGAGKVVISSEKCIGCGACATMCPTGTIEPIRPTDEELIANVAAAAQTNCLDADGAAAYAPRAVIACEKALAHAQNMYETSKVTSVPCLGRIDEGMLLALAAADVESVRLVSGACDDCEHYQGIITTQIVLENAQTLLDTWGCSMQLKLTNKLPRFVAKTQPGAFDESKRAFLAQAKDEATHVGTNIAKATVAEKLGIQQKQAEIEYDHVDETGTLPQAVPSRRARVNAALRALGTPSDEMIDTRLWAHVIINTEGCNSCRMCATFCPTGALKKIEEETDGTFGVSHSPSKCVKCRLCESICPTHSIELSEQVFAVDMIEDEVERYEMREPKIKLNRQDTMLNSMKPLLGVKYISD